MDQIKKWLGENELVQRLLIIIGLLIVIIILTHFIRKSISKNISNTERRYKVRKTANVLGYILFIIAVLIVYSDKLGSVGVVLGIASAGIAFALQEVIVSIAGWLNILLSGNVEVGQRVKVGEITGDIIDISMLKTTIMEVGGWVDGDLYNGRITAISNNFVFNSPIQNYSGDYPFLWDEITIPLRTESDYHKAREIFLKVTNETCLEYAKASTETWNKMKGKYHIVNASVEPKVTLKFDENWITFTIRYVVDYGKRRSTKDKIYTRLLDEIKKHDEIIMIATASVEVTNITKKN